MSNPYANMSTEGHEAREDRAGGGYSAFDSDIYEMDIKAMYAGKSSGGAHSATIIGEINGREYRETIYTTNKKGENSYLIDKSKPDGKKGTMPGYTTVDDICLVTTNKPLSVQTVEDKVIKLWDYDLKREVPTTVPMFVDLIGGKLKVAIKKTLENKTEKKGDEYVDTAETKETNNISKVFEFNSGMTVAEAEHGATEAAFIATWAEKNKGQTADKRTIKDGQAGTSTGAPVAAGGGQAAAGSTAPRASLFGNKG